MNHEPNGPSPAPPPAVMPAHTHEFGRTRDSDGDVFVVPQRVRPARPYELPDRADP